MKKREDGRETRLRLLHAACEIFSQKGYREAKVAEICKSAGANVAAVNYHFGDKANLYREAWRHALEHLNEPGASQAPCASAEDQLREYVHQLMQHLFAESELGRFSRLYLRELVNPTGLIQDAWHELIEPRRHKLHELIRQLISSQAGDLSVLFCELSIINQCRALVTIKSSDLNYMLGQPLSPHLIKQMARHIADFSLAGIRGIAKSGD